MQAKHKPIISRPHPNHLGGVQVIYRFENGFGASVIQTPYSYGGDEGKWELAVIKFDGDEYKLTYDTPITNDVEGYLSIPEVDGLLDKIAELEPAGA